MSTAPITPDVEQEQDETQDQAQPKLSEAATKALETIFQGIMKEEMADRRAEVRKAWQQRNFRNGHQYLWWDDKNGLYCDPSASGQELPRFMDVYNIYTPHWRSFVSILSQNPPGVNFTPNDLQKSRDIMGAASAEKMRHRVDRTVAMGDRQAEVSSYFCTDGRTITWTRIDDKGRLCITTHGVLESKVPIFSRKFEKWGYCVLSEEGDLWETKEEFSDFADDIRADSNDSSESYYERYARLGILANRRGGSTRDEALKNLVTRHDAWIRPSRFRKAGEAEREELKKFFPEGVHATIVSGKCVKYEAQTLEDALCVEFPAPGQGNARPSMLYDLVPICQALNDSLNMLREHVDFSIPATWVSDSIDTEALAEQKSAPGVIHTLTVPPGASIRDLVLQEDVPQLPPELVANVDRYLSLAQFVTGDLPALYGDGTTDQETYQGQKMLSDQAKGQLSPAWAAVQRIFAGTYDIAVTLEAQRVADEPLITVPGPSGQLQFSPAAILDGEWGCYANKDSAFPETTADQRASLQQVLGQLSQAPEGQKITFHPDNLKLIKQYSGLKDLVIPGAEARDKQLREIEQMLRESPVPDQNSPDFPTFIQQAQIAITSGQQPPEPPMTSSVPIGKYDYNQDELDKCIEWLSSPAAYEEIQKGNQAGVQNVQLHADLHADAIAKLAAANAPKPEPMKISAAFKDLDSATKVQALQRDGYQPDKEAYDTDTVLDQQNVAATTQDKAASATHKSVLAAKEAVAPVKKSQVDEVKEE
jgi:hypothetical protein